MSGDFKRLSFLLFLSTIVGIFPLFVLAKPTHALLNPTYSGSRDAATGNLNLSLTEAAGTDFATTKTFRIPAGFDVAAGTSFAQDAVIGSGTFTGVINGTTQTVSFTVFNDLTIPVGDKAHWKFSFAGGAVVLDSFLTGSSSTDHAFSVGAPPANITITTPTSADFTLFGTVGGVPLYTLPSIGGEYTFSLGFTSALGETLSRSFIINLPSLTPSGTNVTTQFNGDISITFDRVLGAGGETTITSSSTPPAAGTGQFQLGGVYYDLNTTANIRCPCTVTIPYDPAVTPSPRIYHLENGTWVDRTTSVDTVNRTVTGVFPSFSFFAVGAPNYSVVWDNPVAELIEKKGNPFSLENDEKLGINFNVVDLAGQMVTPEGITVEIWQTKDQDSNFITPTKVLMLTPTLNYNKSRLQTVLNLGKNPLALGTYEIRPTIDNTAASQTPAIAAFRLVESDGISISISSKD